MAIADQMSFGMFWHVSATDCVWVCLKTGHVTLRFRTQSQAYQFWYRFPSDCPQPYCPRLLLPVRHHTWGELGTTASQRLKSSSSHKWPMCQRNSGGTPSGKAPAWMSGYSAECQSRHSLKLMSKNHRSKLFPTELAGVTSQTEQIGSNLQFPCESWSKHG